MSLISMHGAWLSFSDAPLLDNAELHIEDNERVCLVGRNGAGKSTLLRLLAGEIQPDSGTVELGETVRIGHFSQEGRELDLNQRVYDCIH